MDYRAAAEQLIDFQALLHLAPIARELSSFDRGIFSALNYLLSHGRMAHPKEMCRHMGVSSARVAAMLKHLEQDGLVVRAHDPEDNRQIIVSLTRQGEELIEKKRAEVVDIMAETLEELGPEDAATYVRIQLKLAQNFIRRMAT